MPSFEYNKEYGAYIKRCSCCDTVVVGTPEQVSSEEIFLKHFSPSEGSAQTADGFQSRCWICNSHRRRQLGITIPILRDMMKEQKGQCSICLKDLSIDRNAAPSIHAHVDHDETTGQVRGLLCGDCNRGIGLLKHNTASLHRAIDYLSNFEVKTSVTKIKDRA